MTELGDSVTEKSVFLRRDEINCLVMGVGRNRLVRGNSPVKITKNTIFHLFVSSAQRVELVSG